MEIARERIVIGKILIVLFRFEIIFVDVKQVKRGIVVEGKARASISVADVIGGCGYLTKSWGNI